MAGAFRPDRIIGDREAREIIDQWNSEHPDEQVEYDFPRESGKEFNAETMQLEEPGRRNSGDRRFSISVTPKIMTEADEEEIQSMRDRVGSWMTQENIDKANAAIEDIEDNDKKRKVVFDEFDTIVPGIHPAHYIPEEFLKYVWTKTDDNRIYCSISHMVEHAVNRHPQMELEWYSEFSEFFSDPDEIKESYGINPNTGTMQRSVYFIKDMGSHYSAIVVKVAQDDYDKSGLYYKTFYGHHPKDSKKGRKFLKKEQLLWDKEHGENEGLVAMQQQLPNGGTATFKTDVENEGNAVDAGAKK